MTFALHSLLPLSWCDRKDSLSLCLSSLAGLTFNRVSLLASVRLFPRHLRRLYKPQATEIRPVIVAGKNKQGSRYTVPSACPKADQITGVILPHIYLAIEKITKSHFLHLETF